MMFVEEMRDGKYIFVVWFFLAGDLCPGIDAGQRRTADADHAADRSKKSEVYLPASHVYPGPLIHQANPCVADSYFDEDRFCIVLGRNAVFIHGAGLFQPVQKLVDIFCVNHA